LTETKRCQCQARFTSEVLDAHQLCQRIAGKKSNGEGGVSYVEDVKKRVDGTGFRVAGTILPRNVNEPPQEREGRLDSSEVEIRLDPSLIRYSSLCSLSA
jgi:hypothetical protein